MDAAQHLADRLLADAAWARRLAQELVHDAATADDLVQDAWLAALRRRPDASRPLRPWLGEVIRNAARQLRRGERRRSRREARAARDEALPSTAEMVARAEAHRRLVDAVLALPEPWRRTVMLRWFEGLSAAAIARRTGTPAPTVRWHLQRGQARLRELLDDDAGGDRSRWVTALGPLAGAGLPATAAAAAANTATWIGGWIVTKKTVAATAVLSLLTVAAWLGLGQDGGKPTEPVAGAPSVAAETGAGAAATPADAPPVTAPLDAAPVRVAIPQPAAAAPATLVGRAVDELGRPLDACAVRVVATTTDPARAWTDRRWPHPCGTGRSGVDGRFEVPIDLDEIPAAPGLDFEASVGRDDLLTTAGSFAAPEAGARVDLGDVVVPAGAHLRARVVDEQDRPVGGVRMMFQVGVPRFDGRLSFGLFQGTSTADGSFTLTDDPRLRVGAWNVTLDGSLVLLEPRQLVIPADVAVATPTFRVRRRPASETIAGRVVDIAMRPVAGAEVAIAGSYDDRDRAKTADDGRFELFARSPSDAVQLRVVADGCAPLISESMPWGTRDAELMVEPGTVLDLTVRDETGAPVESYGILLQWSGDPNEARSRLHVDRHVDGRLRAAALGRGGRAAVIAWPTDAEHLPSKPKPFAVPAAGGVVRLEVIAPRKVPFAVEVVTADGEPVAASTVELAFCNPGGWRADLPVVALDMLRFHLHPVLDHWVMTTRIATAVTDANGRATLLGPGTTDDLGLKVSGAAHAPIVLLPRSRPDAGAPLRIVVTAAGRVRGTVAPLEQLASFRMLPGSEPPTKGIGVQLENVDTGERLPARISQSLLIAADGSFEIGGVAAGTWNVRLSWLRPIAENGWRTTFTHPPAARVDVRAGEITTVVLDPGPHRPAVLRGRIERDGRAVAHAPVRLIARRQDAVGQVIVEDQLGGISTDVDGRFVHGGLLPGEYLVLARPIDAGEPDWFPVTDWLTLVSGDDRDVTLRLEARELVVTLVDANGAPATARWLAVFDDARCRHWVRRSDAAGRVSIADAAPGPLRLRLLDAEPPAGVDRTEIRSRPGADLAPIDVLRGEAPQVVERHVPER